MMARRGVRGGGGGLAILLAALPWLWPAPAGAASFTFTLAQAERTSAGVFTPSGTRSKTRGSNVSYPAGTFTKEWDGTDDAGHVAADGSYRVRVLTSRTSYTWE